MSENVMHQAAQDVRWFMRHGTGIGVTTRPPLPPYAERFVIARARRHATFLRLLAAAATIEELVAIGRQRESDAWTEEHEALFESRLAQLDLHPAA